MRTEKVFGVSRYKAKKKCTWASVIAKIGNGWICFESVTDYEVWKNQK